MGAVGAVAHREHCGSVQLSVQGWASRRSLRTDLAHSLKRYCDRCEVYGGLGVALRCPRRWRRRSTTHAHSRLYTWHAMALGAGRPSASSLRDSDPHTVSKAVCPKPLHTSPCGERAEQTSDSDLHTNFPPVPSSGDRSAHLMSPASHECMSVRARTYNHANTCTCTCTCTCTYATCNARMDAWLLILFGKAHLQERQIGVAPPL